MSADTAGGRPWVSVIIPIRDKAAYVLECVGSVADAVEHDGRAELIIVDNGSTDGSRELCEGLVRGPMRVIQAPGTIARVRNSGAASARGEWLYFIDCDCVVPLDLLARLRSVADEPGMSVTGCRVLYPMDRSWVERTWHLMHSLRDDGERVYMNSGNFAVRRDAFEAIGGFDPDLVTGEDAEIGARLRRAGHRLYERQSLAITHLDNPHDLATFFRKEVWRGLGAMGTSRGFALDRPTLFAVLNVLMNAAALTLWIVSEPSLLLLAITVPVMALMPSIAVTGRWLRVRRRFNVPQGILLYWVYLIARAWSLVMIATARPRARRGAEGEAGETAR